MSSGKSHVNIDKALLDPTSVFSTPEEVVDAPTLPHDTKVRILRRWEYDARELAVAEEENMPAPEPDMLDRVLEALHALGSGVDLNHGPPTKQGGDP